MSATRPSPEEIIARLEAGQLPQMVDWFDPMVLGMVGVRTMVSSTIGEYADQRPMQEAADGQRDMDRLRRRSDFSTIDHNRTPKVILPPDADPDNPYCVKLDSKEYTTSTRDDQLLFRSRHKRALPLDGEALWVDFIADLGDGFEATYAMAHLMSKPAIEVPGATRKHSPTKLPAGQILIFGGDMAYPQATEEEYRTRCLEPYDWAFPFTPDESGEERQEPQRELFFIAGNHDWYDGLAAFSNQFCYETSAVGGWRCRQQRSYFALQLPHRWWIWGVDVALGDSLDVAQRHYFEGIVAKQVEPGDKIVIVQHAPDWFKHNPKALTLICQLAREKGDLCAIIAGDLHHYSRYESVGRNPKLQLITSGGGGAFTHPTHDQKSSIRVSDDIVGAGLLDAATKADPTKKEIAKPQGFFARSKDGRITFKASGNQFYPTKSLSRLLALQNLALPIRNLRFALFLGVVFMIYAWVFQISVADPTVAIKQAHTSGIEMQCRAEHPDDADRAARCSDTRKSALGKRLSDLTNPTEPTSVRGRSARTQSAAAKDEVADKVDTLITDVARQGGWLGYIATLFSVQLSPDRVFAAMLASPAFLFLVAGLWLGLVQYAEPDAEPRLLRWLAKLTLGTLHTMAHLTVLLAANSLFGIVYWFFADSQSLFVKVPGILLYTLLMIVIGGMLGALVFGIYWVVTSMLFGMHPDSFSALGIKNYRNFLRMKFEPDRLTIYPVALDIVPGRRGWRPRDKTDTEGSLIQPKRPLRPRLIEDPIVISRSTSFAPR